MPLYRKIFVKIGPVVSLENSSIEIALRVHVVVRCISSNISGYTGPILQSFNHMKALYTVMMEQYFIFPFVKGRCHGHQLNSKHRPISFVALPF